jgi:hypothetical protein
MEEKNNKTAAGALWLRKSKKGNNFLSGSINTPDGNTVKVVVFKNTYKEEGSTQPDYRIYFDESLPPQQKDEKELKSKNEAVDSKKQPIVEEDIPF